MNPLWVPVDAYLHAMNPLSVLVIDLFFLAINFLYIALLPIIFFKRDGRLTPMWWATAAPFIACPLFIWAAWARIMPPATGIGTTTSYILQMLAFPLTLISIALISFTLETHRTPIALWHQDNDAPKNIVTYGPYKFVRHPFYASFLLAFLAAFLYCPQIGTLSTLVYSSIVLNRTAAREERRLKDSEYGKEYEAYMATTGRFFPRLGRKTT